jgi:hypothetical protein
MPTKKQLEEELQDACVGFANDPGGFTRFMYDWGNAELKGWDGPDYWHDEVFQTIKEYLEGPDQMPLFLAICSGHGAAKTFFVAAVIRGLIRRLLGRQILKASSSRRRGGSWRSGTSCP